VERQQIVSLSIYNKQLQESFFCITFILVIEECPDYRLANGFVSVYQLGVNQMNNTYPAVLKLTCKLGYRLTTFKDYVPETSTQQNAKIMGHGQL
ncbi:hypothetical protein CHS0354_017569, partial [Potamilus streckersoni]